MPKSKKRRRSNVHSDVDRLQIAGLAWNFAPFGLVFTAKELLEAARAVVAQEDPSTEKRWHRVGNSLACHSIELSLKAFLALKGERLSGTKGFGHDLSNLLDEAEKRKLGDLVVLTKEETNE